MRGMPRDAGNAKACGKAVAGGAQLGKAQVHRLGCAVLIVLAGLAITVYADDVPGDLALARSEAHAAAAGARFMFAGVDDKTLSNLGDDAEDLVFDLFASNSGPLGITWGEVPESFAQELVNPEDVGASDIVSSPGTVGFVCDGEVEGVSGQLRRELERKGWRAVYVDDVSPGTTFVKDEGVHRWAYVVCSEVSGTVSVSVTTLGGEDGR